MQVSAGLAETDIRESVSTLLDYAPKQNMLQDIPRRIQRYQVRCDVDGEKLRHTWRRLFNIGYARDGLLAAVQSQIRRTQEEIGFEYLRFHGLFDEDMQIYREDASGNPQFNFTYLDLLFDFIRSIGLYAYVELSFMPPTLAREQTQIFDRATIISGCRDLDKWSVLVRATLLHLVERYGRETILRWKFTTISQSYALLGCMTTEEYFALYQTTYRTIKSVDPKICFGGPGGFSNQVWNPEGYKAFLEYAQENACIPDFFSTQYYPHRTAGQDPLFMDFTISQQSAPSVLEKNPDFMANVLHALKELLATYHVSDREIMVEEWNSTLWQRDLSSDTCYKAVWMVKNICENYDQVESFGYWLLTDFIEERAALGSVFHGGYGLFTYNGIPKSGYQAMRFLRQLGNEKIGAGPGWFLTRCGADYQLLLYNYCHYDNLYRYRYRRLEKPSEAYSVFETGEIIRMQIELQAILDGVYRMESRTIARKSGSAFDKWIEIGAPAYMRPDELRYLAEVSQPSYRVQEVIADKGLRLEEVLNPLETQLILLQRMDNPI